MPNRNRRVLIYSHDTFGLGHLRRCRAIAHSLVQHDPGVSVLILSGSPIIGNFEFRERVDFVRIPGVIKLQNGDYTPLKLPMDIEETVDLRANIIRHTALSYEPDVFIVDKEPHGMRGEVLDTLEALKERGTQLVLGLRDILDDPVLLAPEWQNKNVLPALENLYDEIWIYGLPQVSNPLDGLDLPAQVARKTTYTGYLRRELRSNALPLAELPFDGKPYILVTAGGGGDGEQMFDWVLRAYENDPAQPVPAFFVFGPFLDQDLQGQFTARIERLDNVDCITFDNHPEAFISNAAGIVAMGGYNTVCEILSFDKPALIVPRTRPRLEQFLRASRMQEMGLVKMLVPDSPEILDNPQEDWKIMATAIRHLPQQSVPSEVVVPGLLDGLRNVNRLVDIAAGRRRDAMRLVARETGGSQGRHAGQS